eukprot:g10217.t1
MDIEVDTRAGEEDRGEASPSVSFATTSGPKMPPTSEIRRTLQNAVEELSKHGLKLSRKWAAEQLIGLPDATPDEEQQAAELDFAQQQQQQPQRQQEGAPDLWLKGRVAFATALMDVGEFERASQAFGDRKLTPSSATGGSVSGSLVSRARFLRWYSLFLAGERRREEESQLTDALQRRRLVNPHLKKLHTELSEGDKEGTLDAFGLFIYAAVLKAMRAEGRGGQGGGGGVNIPGSNKPGGLIGATATSDTTSTLSQEVLARSLRLFPYNWSAWLDLASLCLETDTVPEALEADHSSQWMYQFFLQHLLVEQHRSTDALSILDNLHVAFPGSSYVLAQTAVAHYHLRNFDQGHADFKELRRRDPLRMEGLDVFSNILYVKECKAELSFLAHTTNKSAPLRPETNCIIGNYYSLKGQHEKAVTYFLKALRLDRRCLSAWTLMGHEFVELKNSGAAVESYRQAVDINPKDYRAWYGLGQAYEILQMHLYAIYYYRRATALRPYDARMWIAMAQCLEKMDKRAEAISTYERAVANDDREGIALASLAKLYSAAGRRDSAAKCYETMLANRSADGDSAAAVDGMQFLCHYYKDRGDYTRASKMANGLLDYTGTSREEAHAVLREIKSIKETLERQSASASFLPSEHGTGGGGGDGGDDSTISADGGGGRPLFTPRVNTAGLSQPNIAAGAISGAASGSRDAYPNRFTRRPRGSGGGDGAGGDYRMMDNSAGASFMARSPGNMSVAMSLGSEDSGDADAIRGGQGGAAGGGGAGSPDGGVGDSFSDILSP